MRKAFADGRVFGAVHGSLPARIVALPGWMHQADDFDAVLAPLATRLPSVALDLPGFGGASPEPTEVWGAADYAAAVVPVIEQDAAKPAVLVGHSRGGAIAVVIAATRPDLVAGIVLTGVPLLRRDDRPPAQPALPYRMARVLHRRGVISDDRMNTMRKKYGSADYRNSTGTMRDILVKVTNETYEAELAKVACPVEMVWGAVDDQVPVSVAERAAALIPGGATLTVVPGVGHQLPTQAPEALTAAIERLLT